MPSQSPFLTVGLKFAAFVKQHSTIFAVISVLGIVILLSPFCIIAGWCLWHDYGPAPPPFNSHKRVTSPKVGLKAPLLRAQSRQARASRRRSPRTHRRFSRS